MPEPSLHVHMLPTVEAFSTLRLDKHRLIVFEKQRSSVKLKFGIW